MRIVPGIGHAAQTCGTRRGAKTKSPVVAGNTLVLRDSQHDYMFTPETSSTPSSADARR